MSTHSDNPISNPAAMVAGAPTQAPNDKVTAEGGVDSKSELKSDEYGLSHSPTELPSPADLPKADVVVFDGHCVFCNAQVSRLNRWDGSGRLAYASLHCEYVKTRCSDLTHDQLMREMYVLCDDGRRFAGISAVRYLTRKLPRLWILVPFLHIPFSRAVWQWLYLQVAMRRYRIAGKTVDGCDDGSCEIHFKK